MEGNTTNKPATELSVGILAYGSLISNPDSEIECARTRVIENIQTPFCVEFARSSGKRGDAPTLVPVEDGGSQVKGQVFVMDLTEEEAANVLYRREIDRVGSGKTYAAPEKVTKNKVLVERLTNFAELDIVLYTRIAATIEPLTAERLADLAIKSVANPKTDPGRDGITYLIDAKRHGIVTALSPAYEAEILRKTECRTLENALAKLLKAANRTG
jgi:cation transport regulator ChaC